MPWGSGSASASGESSVNVQAVVRLGADWPQIGRRLAATSVGEGLPFPRSVGIVIDNESFDQ